MLLLFIRKDSISERAKGYTFSNDYTLDSDTLAQYI